MAENDEKPAQNSGPGVGATLARHGGLSYLEIPAIKARLSAAFYEEVFGWKIRESDTDDPGLRIRPDTSSAAG